jgi:hypothetical protein
VANGTPSFVLELKTLPVIIPEFCCAGRDDIINIQVKRNI